MVTLTATADLGWTFDAWSGDLPGATNPVTTTMDSSQAVTATFRAVSPVATEMYLYVPMIQRN